MSKLVKDFKGTDHAENAQAVLEFATRHKVMQLWTLIENLTPKWFSGNQWDKITSILVGGEEGGASVGSGSRQERYTIFICKHT